LLVAFWLRCQLFDTRFHFEARSQNCEKRLLRRPVCTSVCLDGWNNWASVGQIFIKFDTWVFLKTMEKIHRYINLTRTTGTLHDNG